MSSARSAPALTRTTKILKLVSLKKWKYVFSIR